MKKKIKKDVGEISMVTSADFPMIPPEFLDLDAIKQSPKSTAGEEEEFSIEVCLLRGF